MEIILVEDDQCELEWEVNEYFNAGERHKAVETARGKGRA